MATVRTYVGVVIMSVGLLAPAGCGEESGSQRTDTHRGGTRTSEPGSPDRPEPARYGCGEYCQQAGGYGGGSTAKPMARIDSARSVEILSDGTIPLEVTCVFERPCVGALVLFPLDSSSAAPAPEQGRLGLTPYRSDFRLDAGSTQPFGVIVPRSDWQALQRSGRMEIVANVDLFPTLETLPKDQQDDWNALISKSMVISGPEAAAP